MSKNNIDRFFKVITSEGADEADILMYGYIGQYDLWAEDDDDNESITDLAVAKAIRKLDAKYNKINIRINSPGGSMYHGNAIVTAMQSAKAEIHTWNDGLAASMAADIWLAGDVRHMANNALMMIHAPSSSVWGTAKKMRQEADTLDKWEQTAIAVMAGATDMTEEEIKSAYYDYEDHWLTAKECMECGFISQVEEYETQDVIEDATKMTFMDIMKHFEVKGDEQAKNWLTQLKEKISTTFQKRIGASKTIIKSNQIDDMKTVEDIQKAVEDGTIDKAELLIALGAEQTATPPTPPAPPATQTNQEPAEEKSIAEIVKEAIEAATAPLRQEIKTLKEAPGAKPVVTPDADDPYKGMTEAQKKARQEYEASCKVFEEAGAHGAFER